MRILLLICITFIGHLSFAQDKKTDIAKNLASPERKAILEAVKKKVQPDLKLLPKLVVDRLNTKNNYAFFEGQVKNTEGQEIDWTKTKFKDAYENGAFDGASTWVLLKKTAGKWKVLVYAIGPTDVAWACWWKEFNAPKDIFEIREENCDY